MVEALLMDTAKFRMLELHSLRETVKSRAAAMQALQKARAQLDKHEREKAAVVGKNGRPEKMERLDAQIHEVRFCDGVVLHSVAKAWPILHSAQDKGTVNRCLYRATSMTKGLVQCEIDRLWCVLQNTPSAPTPRTPTDRRSPIRWRSRDHRKEKMSDYKRMMGAYAAAQVAYASKVSTLTCAHSH